MRQSKLKFPVARQQRGKRARQWVRVQWQRARRHAVVIAIGLVVLAAWLVIVPLDSETERSRLPGWLVEWRATSERWRTEQPAVPAPSVRQQGPRTDPMGRPWPKTSGYLAGAARLRANGIMYVEADNTGNRSDVFVRLFWIDPVQPLAVRTVFVKAGDRFRMEKLPAGTYEIRYQELSTGLRYAAKSVELTVTRRQDGRDEYLNWSVGLYPAITGDAPRRVISKGEFEGGVS